jgi:peptidoglycan/LPS O-acetylase OafA/YrhL
MMHTTRSSDGGRLRGFDGLRALAALAIVLLHVTSSTGASVHGPFAIYFARLDAGVTVFFVISAFLLYRPFVADHLDAGRPTDTRRFYLRRAVRIYPAYWVALTAVIVLFRDAHIEGARQYVLQYSLLQIYTPKLLSGIVPAWSLAVEVSFYALLPAYGWFLGRLTARRSVQQRVRVELTAAGVVFVAALVGRAIVGAVAGAGTNAYQLKWLPFMADWFALGLVLAVLKVAFDNGVAGRNVQGVVRTADRAPGALAAVALAAFVVVAHIGLPTTFAAGSVPQDVTRQLMYGVMAVALVAIAALRITGNGTARAALDARVMVALGVISYGIFLWHDAILTQLEQWHFAEHVPTATTLVLFVVVLGAACVVATASWRLVERPLLRRPIGDRVRVRD